MMVKTLKERIFFFFFLRVVLEIDDDDDDDGDDEADDDRHLNSFRLLQDSEVATVYVPKVVQVVVAQVLLVIIDYDDRKGISETLTMPTMIV